MNLKRTIGLILVIAGVILGVAKAVGSDMQSGDWTIRRLRDTREGRIFVNGFARWASLSFQLGLAG